MKIMILNPDYGMTKAELGLRCQILSHFVGPDTQLAMTCLQKTKVEINSALDVVLAGPELVAQALQAELDGFDAVVLYCFSDPALDGCREAVQIPVVGGAQAACLTLPFIGRQAGVILADGARIPEKKLFLQTTGLEAGRLTAFNSIDCHGLDLWQDRDEVLRRLQEAGQALIEKQGVQVLILGCLSFLGLGQPLAAKLQIPVIDPAVAAVSWAEALVRQQLKTSQRSYPGRGEF